MKAGLSPEIRAEQALLGAVLLDPARQAHLLGLVQPGDMTRPYHGQVLAAMQRLRETGVPPGPMAVHQEIKRDPHLPAGVSHDGVLLTDLMEASPRAGHAASYAAMVIGAGIRQQMWLAASRMSQAASSGDLDAALRMAAQARQELDRCRARWEALPPPARTELEPPGPGRGGHGEIARRLGRIRDEIRQLRRSPPEPRILEQRLAGIAQQVAEVAALSASVRERQAHARAAGKARPGGPEAEAEGAQALRNLAAAPAHLSAVRGLLRPGHFAMREQGELYTVMRDLDAAGKPVDPVTVTWEATRRGIAADAADLIGGTGPLAVASAREVRRRGLLAQVEQAGHDIQASASEPAAHTAGFLRSAQDRLARLEPGPAWSPAPKADPLPVVSTRQRRIPAASPRASAAREPVREAAP